jgi:hypothetical protein
MCGQFKTRLFCSVLFRSVLFRSVPFCSVLFRSVPFRSVLARSVLFSLLFCFVLCLFCFVLLCFCSVLFCDGLFSAAIFCSRLFCSSLAVKLCGHGSPDCSPVTSGLSSVVQISVLNSLPLGEFGAVFLWLIIPWIGALAFGIWGCKKSAAPRLPIQVNNTRNNLGLAANSTSTTETELVARPNARRAEDIGAGAGSSSLPSLVPQNPTERDNCWLWYDVCIRNFSDTFF